MKNARLNLAFLRTASDAALEAKIQAVLIAMAGNGNYPSPTVPSLDVIAASLKVFVDAMALSKTRNKVHIALRIQTRAQLVANMRMFANFVTLNANFDRAKLVRTGLDVSAVETTAAKAMGKPQNFKVQLGPNSGEATVICDKLTAAVSFTCYY